jgi:hypothetical protein
VGMVVPKAVSRLRFLIYVHLLVVATNTAAMENSKEMIRALANSMAYQKSNAMMAIIRLVMGAQIRV